MLVSRLLKEGSPILFTHPLASTGRGGPLPVVIRLSSGCRFADMALLAPTGTDEDRSLTGVVVVSPADGCALVLSECTLEGTTVACSTVGNTTIYNGLYSHLPICYCTCVCM